MSTGVTSSLTISSYNHNKIVAAEFEWWVLNVMRTSTVPSGRGCRWKKTKKLAEMRCWLKLPQSLFLCGSVDRARVSHTDKPQLCTPKNSTTKWAETITCWKERWGEDEQVWFSVTSMKFDMDHRVTDMSYPVMFILRQVSRLKVRTFFPGTFLFWNVQLVLVYIQRTPFQINTEASVLNLSPYCTVELSKDYWKL